MRVPTEFFLQTLGVPRLFTRAGAEVKIRVRKHLALLTVLAVEGGRIRRDRLIDMLWPDSPPAHARGSLATAVSFLRSRLGPGSIEPGRDHVELIAGLVGLDLDRLEAGEIIGDDFTPTLHVDAFLGSFLLEGLPEFESWRERQNARLLPAIEQGLVILADYAKRSGNLNELGRHADRLLQLNDLSEPGIKARMEAYALSGDRISALRVYDDWVARLKAEVGASPAKILEDLAARLRRRGWDQPDNPSAPRPVATEHWRNQSFVGRAREYRRLYALWEEVRGGQARQVLITGDGGVGKTTLADRFATSVALEGAGVARARCYEVERGLPYAMIGSVVTALVDRPGASATSPESLAELARIVPDVRRRYRSLPPPTDLTGDSARIRFAEAALELMHAVMEENPVLVVIDDFDQSDEVSLGLIHFLQRRLAAQPLMVVLTARTGEMERRDASTRATLLGDRAVAEVLDVAPLDAEESAALLDALVANEGPRPSQSERRALLSGAAGFPLALEMLVRDWQARGRNSVAFSVGGMTSTVEAVEDGRYDRLTQALLTDLDDTDRVVVSMAAILDRRVGNLDLYKLADLPPARVMGVLTRLIARRALRDAGGSVEWVNPTVRMHAYLQTPPTLRRTLHSLVANELTSTEQDQEANGLELAWHLNRAGRSADAAPLLIMGARYAITHGAPDEAERALSSGLPSLPMDLREDALLTLAESHQAQNDWEASLACLRQVEPVSPQADIANLLRLRAEGALGRIDHTQTANHISKLCEIVRDTGPTPQRLLALSVGARLMTLHVPYQLAAQLLEASDAIAPASLSDLDRIAYLGSQAKLLYSCRRLDEAEVALNTAKSIADARSIRNQSYYVLLGGFSAIASARGDYVRCLDQSIEQFHAYINAGWITGAHTAANNASTALIRLGRYQEAINWASRSETGTLYAPDIWDIRNHSIGLASYFLGERAITLRCAASLLECDADTTSPNRRRGALLYAADLLRLVGRHRQALDVAERALAGGLREIEDIGMAGRTARWVGALEAREGRHLRAREYVLGLLRLSLDAYDHAECLYAARLLGATEPEIETQLKQRLHSLPPPVTEQIRRLFAADELHAHSGEECITIVSG